jgi:hypothetical protein
MSILTEEHCDYLISLRDSGETNMWGASPYIAKEFNVNHDEASKILVEWIKYMSKEK